jgi:hypothetical protein
MTRRGKEATGSDYVSLREQQRCYLCFRLIPIHSILALFRLYQVRNTSIVCISTDSYTLYDGGVLLA